MSAYVCEVCGATESDMFIMDWDSHLIMCESCIDKTIKARTGGLNKPAIYDNGFMDSLLRI